MHLHSTRARLGAVGALAATSLALLLLTRPLFPAGSWSRGDELTLAAAWAIAVAASTWLLTASAACLLALGVHRPHLARAFARTLPSGLRRSVEVAIVASCLAVSAAPAHAANSHGSVIDQPVVRALQSPAAPSSVPNVAPRTTPTAPHQPIGPRVPAAAPSTRPAALSSRPTSTDATAPATTPRRTHVRAHVRGAPMAAPSSSPSPSARSLQDARVVVRPGDNLWRIARAELIRISGAYPNDGEVAHYWRAVIDANRTTLRSGNPSLIFPGEIVTLPPVPPVS